MYIIHNIPTPKKEYTVCCPQARKENKKSGCPHIKTSNRHPIGIFGADDETRTRDLILTKDVRYHLCHISKRRLVL